MIYYKICSHEHGQQCDLFPYGSIHHSDKIKDGKIINSNSELLPPFEIEKLEEKPETKHCPAGCRLEYSIDTPFIETQQIGDPKQMCITCFEKRYILGHRNKNGYSEALRKLAVQALLKKLPSKEELYQYQRKHAGILPSEEEDKYDAIMFKLFEDGAEYIKDLIKEELK